MEAEHGEEPKKERDNCIQNGHQPEPDYDEAGEAIEIHCKVCGRRLKNPS